MGSYVQANLMASESIVYEARVHWIVYRGAAVTAIAGLPFLAAPAPVVLLAIPFFVLSAIFALKAFILCRSTELVITDRRLIAKFGFIRRSTFEKHIDKLEGINLEQAFFARLIGYGTIVVGGLGGSSVPVPFIGNPQLFKKRLYEVIEQNTARPSSAAA